MARHEITKDIFAKLGYLLMKRHLKKLFKKIDYSEYGGAPLLGINGISIVSHGHSNPKAIKNAIRVARDFHEKQVNKHIQDDIEAMVAGTALQKKRVGEKEGALK